MSARRTVQLSYDDLSNRCVLWSDLVMPFVAAVWANTSGVVRGWVRVSSHSLDLGPKRGRIKGNQDRMKDNQLNELAGRRIAA